MSNARIVHAPYPDAVPENEAAMLAAVYRFVIEASHRCEKAVELSGDGSNAEAKNISTTRVDQPDPTRP